MDHSPYVERPLLLLAVALPGKIAQAEAYLATARPTEKARFRRRAELIRDFVDDT